MIQWSICSWNWWRSKLWRYRFFETEEPRGLLGTYDNRRHRSRISDLSMVHWSSTGTIYKYHVDRFQVINIPLKVNVHISLCLQWPTNKTFTNSTVLRKQTSQCISFTLCLFLHLFLVTLDPTVRTTCTTILGYVMLRLFCVRRETRVTLRQFVAEEADRSKSTHHWRMLLKYGSLEWSPHENLHIFYLNMKVK